MEDKINNILEILNTSKRSMPAHFSSSKDRTQTFLVNFDVPADDEYEMSSYAWYHTPSQGIVLVGEDLMLSAYIASVLKQPEITDGLKAKIIETNKEIIKNTDDESKYFEECVNFGIERAKNREKTNELVSRTEKLALEGKHITVPLLKRELDIEDEFLIEKIINILVNSGKIIYAELAGERFWISTQKLNVNFGMPNNPDKDQKLIDLVVSAKKKEINVYTGTVDIEKIKPFCEYKPEKESFKKTKESLKNGLIKGDPPLLHVYQDGEYLIMSDDYNAYYMYKDEEFTKVPCVIFGETDIEGIQDLKLVSYS